MPGIDFNGMPVSPGDEMQAFVYWASGTTWETCLEDLTTGISGLMVTGEGWGVTTGGCASTFTEQRVNGDVDLRRWNNCRVDR